MSDILFLTYIKKGLYFNRPLSFIDGDFKATYIK